MKLRIPTLSEVKSLNRSYVMSRLTRFEEVILRLLQSYEGRTVTHHEITAALAPMRDNQEVNSNSSEVLIARIRRKGYPIQVVRGSGYRIQPVNTTEVLKNGTRSTLVEKEAV